MKHADQTKVDSIVKELNDSVNKFVPSSNNDLSDYIEKFINLIFKETMQLLNHVQVQGFFDN